MSTAHTSTPIQVHERGAVDDPLAVLIHSTGISGADMVDRFGLAVPGYHVLAPDRTNYGQSRRSIAGGNGRSNGQVPEVAMIQDDAKEIGAHPRQRSAPRRILLRRRRRSHHRSPTTRARPIPDVARTARVPTPAG